ncbi:GDSL-type esterase/lipase family protein [Agromyces laixinhei]|uniref:GDSL-type esterase/lipase family protein n=1 Tax=Agromyces laixinhei TaxID=2585717 RepID=UPI0012ECDAFC|nr:SGNH/GDSL hydrolase family protein [Agromyces laixinhei]
MSIEPTDPRLDWRGLAEWERVPEGWRPWRLPSGVMRALDVDDLAARARDPAGVRLEVVTDADAIRIEVVAPEDSAPFDVCVDGVLDARLSVTGRCALEVGLDGRRHLVEIWLPQFGNVVIGEVEFVGARTIGRRDAAPRRWSTYGSSITQCRSAAGPTETWPAIVARTAGWDLGCFGFNAQSHLDPPVAGAIRDRGTDLISLCLGINVYGASSFSRRSFVPAIAGFVDTIRSGHPVTPVLLISPISSPERELVANAVGLTLQEVRLEIERAARFFAAIGDGNVHYLDGREIIGETEATLLADGLHPSPEGYRVMAERLRPRLEQLMPRM